MLVLLDDDFSTVNASWHSRSDQNAVYSIGDGVLGIDASPGPTVGDETVRRGNWAAPTGSDYNDWLGWVVTNNFKMDWEIESFISLSGDWDPTKAVFSLYNLDGDRYLEWRLEGDLTDQITLIVSDETGDFFVTEYDPVLHRWLRIEIADDGSLWNWATSSDGISWVSHYSIPATYTYVEVIANLFAEKGANIEIARFRATTDTLATATTNKLVWDQTGERFYRAGVDRGVLFLSDGSGVAWNGLISVEETVARETKEFYLDGVKYLEHQVPGNFSGKLKAFTYPDEFDEVLGINRITSGLFLHDQRPSMFGLSYRTKLGNDVDGTDYGYQIHIIWNLLATPDTISNSTLTDSVAATELSWTLSATPEIAAGYRPTAHLSFRSTDLDEDILRGLEELLYGTETSPPTLPSLTEVLELTTNLGNRSIIDNGDGTWTATGDNVSVFGSNDSFVITDIAPVYQDEDDYQIEENPATD